MDVTLALQRAVRGFGLGSAALAARLGVSPTSLAHKVSPTYTAAHCSPEECLVIMEVTGDHGALHAMAGGLGYVLLPVPSLEAGGESMQALAKTVGEFGELCSQVATAVADGHITDNERARIEAEGAEALAAIEVLLQAVARANLAGKAVRLAA